MHLPISVTQDELLEVLLQVAPVRPVFIWGAPGIGKSALVEKFADEVGLPCVSLLGSQLAPEDIIGIPQIRGETSDLLSAVIAEKMRKAAPTMHYAEVPGVGHAPMLDEPEAKAAIFECLRDLP